MAYAETPTCRRRFLLHYFGENFGKDNCEMCDNCRHPKERIEVKGEMVQALQTVLDLDENYGIKALVDFVLGKDTKEMKDYGFDQKSLFGIGRDKGANFWSSVFRQALLNDLLYKDIESYGLLKMTDKGRAFIKKPHSFPIPLNHDYEEGAQDLMAESNGNSNGAVLDETLMHMLKDLRKQESRRKNVPPFVIFQDPSLEDMATQYPISLDDMAKITGVSKGKALRYGRPFLDLIGRYVEENEIDRPTDFVVKQVANKSKVKVNIIQAIDRKIPLEDIASANDLRMEELLEELDAIVSSGTKVNIDYYLEDNLDEYAREEIYDYFLEAKTDAPNVAFQELQEEDITMEEIQLVRIKFLSDLAN